MDISHSNSPSFSITLPSILITLSLTGKKKKKKKYNGSLGIKKSNYKQISCSSFLATFDLPTKVNQKNTKNLTKATVTMNQE